MPSSYAIGERFENFIKDQLATGRYDSASEVVREGLRLLEERERMREARRQYLRKEIARGIGYGPGKPVEDVFGRLIAKYEAIAAAEDVRK